jgi:hypothetical protein
MTWLSFALEKLSDDLERSPKIGAGVRIALESPNGLEDMEKTARH